MRDSKSLILLLLACFSLVLSIVLGYYFFNETKKQKQEIEVVDNPSLQKDTLQSKYVVAVSNLSDLPASSTTNLPSTDAATKMDDLYQLKDEINAILKNSNSSKADLEIARQKIEELQRKVEELRNRNTNIEEENRRLSALLKQIAGGMNMQEQTAVKPAGAEIRTPVENRVIENPGANVFSAYNLSLQAINGNTDQETVLAEQTEKLTGSFTVKNNLSQLNNAEMMIVVLQPNGKVLQSSPWESGTFTTTEGKKIYSCKIRFDYRKGEARQCNFSITADNYPRGNYTFQVYYNGVVIGRMVKSLG